MLRRTKLLSFVSLILVIILSASAVCFADTEPNNSTSQAEYLYSSSNGSVSATDPFDTYYTYGTGSSGAVVISFTAYPNQYNEKCQMWVYDSNKNLLADNVTSYTIPPYNSAKYYFQIVDMVSPGATNTYTISATRY